MRICLLIPPLVQLESFCCKKSPNQEICLRTFLGYRTSEGSEWYQIDPRWLRGHSCLGCPKYSKHLIFDPIRTFRIFRNLDLIIFENWISVFVRSYSNYSNISDISNIFELWKLSLAIYNRPISFSLFGVNPISTHSG